MAEQYAPGSMLLAQPPMDPNAMMNAPMMGQPSMDDPTTGGQYLAHILMNGPNWGASVPQDVTPGMNSAAPYLDASQGEAAKQLLLQSLMVPQGNLRRPAPDSESIPPPPTFMNI